MRKEGDIVRINGNPYTLGSRIGGGLEGTVFNISDGPEGVKVEKFVIKIINDSGMTLNEKLMIRGQLERLCRFGKNNEDFKQRMALPKSLLDDDIGYIMKKTSGYESLKRYLSPPDNGFEDWFKTKYPLRNRYLIISYLFETLRELHLKGLTFVDLSPTNIVVRTGENGIVFIDTDNIRFRDDLPIGVMGTPGYIAPEIYRKNVSSEINGTPVDGTLLSKTGRVTSDSDIFSAAVIAFELLTLHHPFVGDIIDDGTPEDEERAMRIETDYIFKDGTENTSTRGLTTIFDKITTPHMRDLFRRTFVEGRDNPLLRPTDMEFLEAAKNAIDKMVTCECGFGSIYDTAGDNKCLACGSELGPYAVLSIYSGFREQSRADGINGIADMPECDVTDEGLKSLSTKDDSDYLLSEVVLSDRKILYRRHFETTADRTGLRVELEPHEDKLSIFIVDKDLSDVKIERSDGDFKRLSLKKKYEVDMPGEKSRSIVFELKDHAKGWVIIYGELRRI